MVFTDKEKTKRCDSCDWKDFEVMGESFGGKEVRCPKCGHCDVFTWKDKRWEGERERYERNPTNY